MPQVQVWKHCRKKKFYFTKEEYVRDLKYTAFKNRLKKDRKSLGSELRKFNRKIFNGLSEYADRFNEEMSQTATRLLLCDAIWSYITAYDNIHEDVVEFVLHLAERRLSTIEKELTPVKFNDILLNLTGVHRYDLLKCGRSDIELNITMGTLVNGRCYYFDTSLSYLKLRLLDCSVLNSVDVENRLGDRRDKLLAPDDIFGSILHDDIKCLEVIDVDCLGSSLYESSNHSCSYIRRHAGGKYIPFNTMYTWNHAALLRNCEGSTIYKVPPLLDIK